jgi:hypothetical protein
MIDLKSLECEVETVTVKEFSSLDTYIPGVLDRGIPEGFSFVGFRQVEHLEWYIAPEGSLRQRLNLEKTTSPYIVLRKLEKRSVVKFVATGEYLPPKEGQWYKDCYGQMLKGGGTDGGAYPIFTRHESFEYVDPKEGVNE